MHLASRPASDKNPLIPPRAFEPTNSIATIFPQQGTKGEITLMDNGNEQMLFRDPLKAAYESKALYFYVWGEITYKDIFRKPHHTNFCAFFLNDGTGEGTSCQMHNSAE